MKQQRSFAHMVSPVIQAQSHTYPLHLSDLCIPVSAADIEGQGLGNKTFKQSTISHHSICIRYDA